jgi:thiol-disulfide isomerase/thioredoxin
MKLNRSILLLIVLVAGIIIGKYFYNKPGLINGDNAIEISGKGLHGQTISLEALRGSYVLIDFWGSWCGPCRKENPAIRKLYDELNGSIFNDGAEFHILSIGIEKDSASWINAINKDGLNWEIHISEIAYFDSPIAKSYGVRSIPAKFLVDPLGKIIGVNQTPEEIGSILRKRVKKD